MESLEQPFDQLREMVRTRPEGPSTVARLEAGVHHIRKEVVEEAAEVWMAAEHESIDDTALEISQLLHHLQVMMIALDLDLEDVYWHLRAGGVKIFKTAVPNKDSLVEAATNILRAVGYWQRVDFKDLTLADSVHDVEFYYLRPRDIAVHVGEGHLDVGVTGRDMPLDSDARATEVMPLGFGGSRLRLAAPAGRPNDIAALVGRRIVTSYPGLLGRWLGEHGIETNLVKLDGVVESAIRLGMVDVVVDVVNTGTTLQRAGLEVFGEPICASEATLIWHDEDIEPKGPALLCTRLESALVAQNCLVMDCNIAESDLEAATALASGVNGPTVSHLAEPGWTTVRVLVPRRGAYLLMDRLFEVGARDIILTELNAARL